MKKTLWLLLILSLPSLAWSQDAGTGPGCGLGAVAFEGDTGLGPHISAATTNQSSYSQLLGIVSGTSGCGEYEPIQVSAAYIRANQEQFAIDLSRGDGEVLENYFALLGVETEDTTALKRYLKTHFSEVYTRQDQSALETANALNRLLKKHETLSKYAV